MGTFGRAMDPVYVLATTEAGTAAAVMRAAAMIGVCAGSISVLVPRERGESVAERARLWRTAGAGRLARHRCAAPVSVVECDGWDRRDLLERHTPAGALVLVGGRGTPWWLPWITAEERFAVRLAGPERDVRFVAIDGVHSVRPASGSYPGGPRVRAGRTIGHPQD